MYGTLLSRYLIRLDIATLAHFTIFFLNQKPVSRTTGLLIHIKTKAMGVTAQRTEKVQICRCKGPKKYGACNKNFPHLKFRKAALMTCDFSL